MPDKAIVYMDGLDARIFKQLLYKLGSEERVQNAIILNGLLSKSESPISLKKAGEIKASFPEYVGVTFDEFNHILEDIEES